MVLAVIVITTIIVYSNLHLNVTSYFEITENQVAITSSMRYFTVTTIQYD